MTLRYVPPNPRFDTGKKTKKNLTTGAGERDVVPRLSFFRDARAGLVPSHDGPLGYPAAALPTISSLLPHVVVITYLRHVRLHVHAALRLVVRRAARVRRVLRVRRLHHVDRLPVDDGETVRRLLVSGHVHGDVVRDRGRGAAPHADLALRGVDHVAVASGLSCDPARAPTDLCNNT